VQPSSGRWMSYAIERSPRAGQSVCPDTLPEGSKRFDVFRMDRTVRLRPGVQRKVVTFTEDE